MHSQIIRESNRKTLIPNQASKQALQTPSSYLINVTTTETTTFIYRLNILAAKEHGNN